MWKLLLISNSNLKIQFFTTIIHNSLIINSRIWWSKSMHLLKILNRFLKKMNPNRGKSRFFMLLLLESNVWSMIVNFIEGIMWSKIRNSWLHSTTTQRFHSTSLTSSYMAAPLMFSAITTKITITKAH